MSNEEPAAGMPAERDAPLPGDTGAEGPAEAAGDAGDAGDARPDAPESVTTTTTMEVGLVRSVRYGPILIGGAIVGAAIAAFAALLFPISEDAEYTMGQVVGFVAVLGGAVGLMLGAVLALVLGRVARRSKGAGIAVLTDVR